MKKTIIYITVAMMILCLAVSCKKEGKSIDPEPVIVVSSSAEPQESSSVIEPSSSVIESEPSVLEPSSSLPESSVTEEVEYQVEEEDIYGKAPETEHILAANGYLDILKEYRETIENYYWQFMDEEFFSIGSRAILVENILGNDIPELIFVEGISDFESVLRVFTYKDGGVSSVLNMSFDVQAAGGSEYHVYRKSGRNNLFLELINGDETLVKKNIELVYRNGNIELNTLSYIEDPEEEEVYTYNGTIITKEKYDEIYDILKCEDDSNILLFNTSHLLNNNKKLRINSLSYEGAQNYLKAYILKQERSESLNLTLTELSEIRSAEHTITITDEVLEGKLKIDSARGREVCIYSANITGIGKINDDIYFVSLGEVVTEFDVGLIASYEGETTYFIEAPFQNNESIYVYMPGADIRELSSSLYNFKLGDSELVLISDPIDYAVVECKQDSFIFNIS